MRIRKTVLIAALAFGLCAAGHGPASAQKSGGSVWRAAAGYAVSISGESPRMYGQVFQSRDFQKLLLVPDSGDETFVLNLVEKTVASIPMESITVEKGGATIASGVIPKFLNKMKRDGAVVTFETLGRNFRLEPQAPLVGESSLKSILEQRGDYGTAAGNYEPDTTAVARIRLHSKPVEIVVFFGTWCGSCKRYLPQFMKTIEVANNPKIKVRYVAVSESYREPRDLIEKYNMHLTPSFIVMDGTKEVGRIKGKPVLSVERDLAEILFGQ